MIAPARFLTHSLRLSPHGPAIARILAAGIQAVDPGAAVARFVQREKDELRIASNIYSLDNYRRTFIIAFGKASLPMTESLANILGDRLTGGVVIPKHAAGRTLGRLTVMEGGHPIPDERSLAAGQRVIELLSGLGADDLLFCLISGGGSALMTAPIEGVTLSDLQSLTSALLACGASIDEINILRRHLDRLKGGGLARLASPARVVSLILSDVIGNPLEAIASGATAPDPTTCADALAVLDKYQLHFSRAQNEFFTVKPPSTNDKRMNEYLSSFSPKTIFYFIRLFVSDSLTGLVHKRKDRVMAGHSIHGKAPKSVLNALRSGQETLKPGDDVFRNVDNILVGSNLLAAQAALKQAEAEGFHPYLLRTDLQGEARQVAVELCRTLRWAWQTGDPAPRPACIVAGGETTVTLRGDGRGGRNTELALASVTELANFPEVMLVALATDGEDGPTDAAGAVVTGETFAHAYALGLDPVAHLTRNDSYPFFAALDDLLKPGPTGTNVNDLTFLFTSCQP
ncbi:MAG: glycerate kinase [Chloroflexi bacterium]|nr:glycerate kinase [Chloroflexota bacterium]